MQIKITYYYKNQRLKIAENKLKNHFIFKTILIKFCNGYHPSADRAGWLIHFGSRNHGVPASYIHNSGLAAVQSV